MSDAPVDVEVVRTLASLQGLSPPEEDLEPLAAALAGQFAAALRILERYGDVDLEPPLVFDARWE